MFEQLGLIGCGLMGGSFALAARRAGVVKRVTGFSKSPESCERARQLGVIDVAASSAQEAAAGSDLVLLAIPVAASETTFAAIRAQVTPQTLVLDVGSTKRDVVDAARRALRMNAGNFVPSHPITGREVAGVENADPDLYEGKQVILTPIKRTLPEKVEQASALWQALGCRVTQMTPQAHDAAFAAVSHLPHLIAFALINSLMHQSHGKDYLGLAGPGFRDFSRIAAADPHMWRDVLIANREEIAEQSRRFKDALSRLEKAIAASDGDVLERLITQASHTRATLRLTSGAR